ncbi:hypothetical protein [uncultured Cytophaga sp.]|mgnify:CR=1 FL=1|uniref:hypothetical protein n=1 Tax=uncultured Cytophaga sp. TaxID=160238 RepID=UPI00262D8C03|nr:hypothetical protein [uncultured Cytophaga sp.]
MTFEEYCIKKKIDSAAFFAHEPGRWQNWKEEFEQMHPNSFTEQKKFLINETRRKYLLQDGSK